MPPLWGGFPFTFFRLQGWWYPLGGLRRGCPPDMVTGYCLFLHHLIPNLFPLEKQSLGANSRRPKANPPNPT